MNLLLNDKIDKTSWKEFVSSNAFSSPFQTPSFYKFINSLNSEKAEVLAIADEHNNIKSLALVVIHKEKGVKKYFSKRGIIYGGPLFTDNESAQYLLEQLRISFKKKIIYLEIRNFFDYSQYSSFFKNTNFTFESYLNVILKTSNSSMDEVSVSMNKTRARQIRQTIRKGAIAKNTNDQNEIKELYDILEDLYRNKVKLPLPDFSFFKNLSKSPVGKVFVSTIEGEVIGGAFTLFLENRGIYTYYYCGKEGKYKNVYPTHLALNEVIKYAIEHDLTHVDFMGAGIKGKDYGVRTYKQRFGGETVEYGRYLLITKPLLYRIGKFGLSILQRIK